MDTALFGVLLGFGLGVIFKTIDILIQWRGQRRLDEEQARKQVQWDEEHAQSRAELDARWEELEERHRRIATILDNLPTTRRKRELADTADKAVAEERFDEAITALRELSELDGSPEERAALLATLGGLIYKRGNSLLYALYRYEEALGHHQQALVLFREVGDRLGEANALRSMGDALRMLDRYEEALGHHQQALVLYREVGSRLGEANALNSMGDALRLLARYEEALGSHQQALPLYREVGSRLGEANALNSIAIALRSRDLFEEALKILKAAEAEYSAGKVRHNLELLAQGADSSAFEVLPTYSHEPEVALAGASS